MPFFGRRKKKKWHPPPPPKKKNDTPTKEKMTQFTLPTKKKTEHFNLNNLETIFSWNFAFQLPIHISQQAYFLRSTMLFQHYVFYCQMPFLTLTCHHWRASSVLNFTCFLKMPHNVLVDHFVVCFFLKNNLMPFFTSVNIKQVNWCYFASPLMNIIILCVWVFVCLLLMLIGSCYFQPSNRRCLYCHILFLKLSDLLRLCLWSNHLCFCRLATYAIFFYIHACYRAHGLQPDALLSAKPFFFFLKDWQTSAWNLLF